MFTVPEKIIYALPEQIGNTELFVGRKKEFDTFWEIGTITWSIIWLKAKRSSPGERKGRRRFCSDYSISCGAARKQVSSRSIM